MLVLNLAVILWGAFVRATGSGAGCGAHWPLCNGEVLPPSPTAHTLIELTHRATSGLALIAVAWLTVWVHQASARGHPARAGAKLSMGMILFEAAVGAGLVLFGLVADDDSVARAIVMVVHLVSTFVLLAALLYTAWTAAGGLLRMEGERGALLLLTPAVIGMVLVGSSGAIAALGDTLFPSATLRQALADDLSPTAHALIRLRVLHPLLAVLTTFYCGLLAVHLRARGSGPTRRAATSLMVLLGIQLACGLLNVALLAPVWLQLVHLLLADLTWLCLLYVALERLRSARPGASVAAADLRARDPLPGGA